jgi:two-component system phosphate regulon sensor histidine kinase PhoR
LQDIRWNTFWALLFISFLSLIVLGFKSLEAASFFFIACLSVYLFSHLYWIYRLNKWLKNPNLSTIPNGSGVWEEIFSTLYREYKKQKKSKSELTTTLGRFMTAAEAIPDGIIALNQNNEIEWCNKPSEKMFGIHLSKDINQPINYLLRETSFTEYLNDNKYDGTLKLTSWRNTGRSFEILIVPFGANQKLLISRDITQLEKNDSIKRDFIANVSHELKTPLTVIVGFLETLSDMKNEFNEKTRPYLLMMLEQSDRMKKLVEDLLQLSSIESNAAPAEKKEINMSQLFKGLKKDSELISKKEHKINMSINKDITLLGYEKEIYSAFFNLISNAIRYTKKGGAINVIWGMKDEKAYFEVQDSGIGIHEKLIPRLTERFYRIDADRSRKSGGTGLGLSIVKHICIRHQAQIEITSQIGKGSQFKIIFPQERILIEKK